MGERLTFAIKKYDLQEISDSQLAIMRLYVVSDGENLNGSHFSLDNIKKCESTIFKKPILYKYSSKDKDFEEHNKDEIPCGYIPEINNNLTYEEQDDGKTFLVIDAIIWKYYALNVLKVFDKKNIKSISMEIDVIDSETNEDGIIDIKEFAFLAVTLLGDKYNPGIENAKAEIIKFSKENLNEMIEEIDTILHKYSFKEVIPKPDSQNQVDTSTNNANSDKQNFVKEGDIVPEFNKEEFAKQFSITAMQVKDMMNEMCADKKYKSGDYEYEKYWVRDYDASYAYAYDYELSHCVAIPYSVSDGKIQMDFDSIKRATTVTQWIISDEEDETLSFVNKLLQDKEEKFAKEVENIKEEFSAKIIDLEKEKEEFSSKVSTAEQEKEEIATKFSTLEQEHETIKTENEQLKTFKSNIEEQEKQNKIEFAIQSVVEDLTQEQVDEWRNKVEEFANVDEFSNAIKAFAYSVAKQKQNPDKQEFSRIHIPPTPDKVETNKSLWERI